MKNTNNLKFALSTAVLVEKQSFDFYRYAEKMVGDTQTREVFRLLASEEAEHLGIFHRLYMEYQFGNMNELINLPANLDTLNYQALARSVNANMQEKESLEIALREELSCIRLYSDLINTFNDNCARTVFDQALLETRIHSQIIQTEYKRILSHHGNNDCAQEPHNLIVINPIADSDGYPFRLADKSNRLLLDTRRTVDMNV